VGLKLNGTHQLLAYAEIVNLLGIAIKKNTVPLTDASIKSCTERKQRKLSVFCCLVTKMQGKTMK
jgi:hypothetical protein